MAALEVTEIPDIVDGSVAALNLERVFTGSGQRGAFFEKRIEDDLTASVGFAPDTEVAREFFAKYIAGFRVGLNRESDCGSRTRVSGAAHAPAEGFFQNAADKW